MMNVQLKMSAIMISPAIKFSKTCFIPSLRYDRQKN